MATILRVAALGLLGLALVLHVVGFATNGWISADLDKNGIDSVLSANGMAGAMLPNKVGLSIRMGLWKFCMHVNLGLSQNVPGVEGTTDMCQKPDADDVPDWMKAVQALGILSMLVGVVGVALCLYGFFGDGKGDRARLLPVFQGFTTLLAGILLLVAVIVYGAEYNKMMQDQLSMMGTADPSLRALYQNVADHVSLGYSFVLEVVAALLMILVTVVIAVTNLRTFGGGSANNMAI